MRLSSTFPIRLHASLSPQVAGAWSRCSSRALCFTAEGLLPLGARETLRVSLGRDRDAPRLFVARFSVMGRSVALAQVLLA